MASLFVEHFSALVKAAGEETETNAYSEGEPSQGLGRGRGRAIVTRGAKDNRSKAGTQKGQTGGPPNPIKAMANNVAAHRRANKVAKESTALVYRGSGGALGQIRHFQSNAGTGFPDKKETLPALGTRSRPGCHKREEDHERPFLPNQNRQYYLAQSKLYRNQQNII